MRKAFVLMMVVTALVGAYACGGGGGGGGGESNTAPIADAGDNQTVQTESIVNLNGSGSSDADGDDLTYLWSLESIPGASRAASSFSSYSATNPTFEADIDGDYVIGLLVDDGTDSSVADTVRITASSNFPPTPTGLTRTTRTTNSVGMSWTDNSLNEDFFNVYQGSAVAETVPANTTTNTLGSLNSYRVYSFKVTAENSDGESGDSNVLKVVTRPDISDMVGTWDVVADTICSGTIGKVTRDGFQDKIAIVEKKSRFAPSAVPQALTPQFDIAFETYAATACEGTLNVEEFGISCNEATGLTGLAESTRMFENGTGSLEVPSRTCSSTIMVLTDLRMTKSKVTLPR
jgi:hypothetical protein